MSKAPKAGAALAAPEQLSAPAPTPDAVPGQQAASADPTPDGDSAPVVLPAAVRLLRPYGFIDQAGVNRFWQAGTVVADPDDVAALVGRGAPVISEE